MLTTRGRNIFYFIIAGLILIGLVIFFGSKFVLGDDSPVLQSDFNVEYNELDNTYITLRRWEYNPKKDLMEIEISTRSVSNFAFAPELKFSAKTRKDPDVELSVKKVFQLDGVYVVQVQHVPEDFEVVALVIEEEERHFHDHDEDEHDHDHGNEFINKPVLSLYGDYRKLQHNIELTSKSEVEYIEEQINFEIEQLKVEKDNLSKSIPLQDGVIQQLEREIEYLIANKEYQTEQQQQETDGQIDTKKNLIEMAEVEKEEMKKLLREVNERIENLEKKKNDQLEKLAKE